MFADYCGTLIKNRAQDSASNIFCDRERSADRTIDTEEGQIWRCLMPRMPDNPDRNYSATPNEDDIDADIEELFASRPLGLFDNPIVQARIGSLIALAINRTERHHRRRRPR
jgi:hypothetical protein